jgi:hypothetical protein
MEEVRDKAEDNTPKRDESGKLLPGTPSLNPAGRPKGKTLKEFAREYLMNLPDDEKKEYLAQLPREIVWKMAEGNPHQTSDETIDVTIAKPLLEAIKPVVVELEPSEVVQEVVAENQAA